MLSDVIPTCPPSYMTMYKGGGKWTYNSATATTTIFDSFEEASTQSEIATTMLLDHGYLHDTTHVEAYRPEVDDWVLVFPPEIAMIISDLVSV